MYPKPIESYFVPNSLDEALRLLSANREAKVIAGGQSLVPMLKLRLLEPKCLIDLNRIARSEARDTGHAITVGAMESLLNVGQERDQPADSGWA
ncbi:MAG: hypothetical protein C5B58_13100 [Acidobacteria bacterium]|nr:MAG: hypothetical protein C5B58_13100 [Acidobacteriota bacterium]